MFHVFAAIRAMFHRVIGIDENSAEESIEMLPVGAAYCARNSPLTSARPNECQKPHLCFCQPSQSWAMRCKMTQTNPTKSGKPVPVNRKTRPLVKLRRAQANIIAHLTGAPQVHSCLTCWDPSFATWPPQASFAVDTRTP